MQEIDWNTTLERNRFFSILPESEQANLLKETSTKEREYPKGVKIFEEDDLQDKVYLIGSGVVEVYLLSKKKEKIVLNNLVRGDLVGEMAILDQKRRSANVMALEDCLALEMDGQVLRNIRERYPRFASELSALADERLRHLGNEVIATGQDDIDKQIRQLELRLDAQQQTINTKLEAAQTVFDQTSRRASEIIESAERARSRLASMFTFAATLLSIIIGVSGWLGYSEVKSFNSAKVEVDKSVKEVKSSLAAATEAKKQIEGINEQLVLVKEAIIEFHKKYTLDEFFKAVGKDQEEAKKKFNSALSVGNTTITDILFISRGAPTIFKGDGATRNDFRTILDEGIDAGRTKTNLQKGYSYTLLLTAMILMGEEDEDYRRTLASFDDFLMKLKMQDDTALPKEDLSETIEDLYNLSVSDPDPETLGKIKRIWKRLH